jgi:hypothetical protein
MTAAIDLIGRTGATSWQLRYSDDEEPVVWMAVASYDRHGAVHYEAAAALAPAAAVFRLCAQLMDGGQCTHCRRPSGFSEDLDDLPAGDLVCWYQWDPERATFRRGCESDAA